MDGRMYVGGIFGVRVPNVMERSVRRTQVDHLGSREEGNQTMSWREPTIRDLTAKLSQVELDSFRKYPDYKTATDPGKDILELVAETVRGFCRSNKQVKMCPQAGTIPEGLMTFAMDFAVYDVLKRINVNVNDARKAAWEKANEVFQMVAEGKYIPESYEDGQEDDTSSNKAMPGFCAPRRKRLNNWI